MAGESFENQSDSNPPPGVEPDTSQDAWPPTAAEFVREMSEYLILERLGVDPCGAVFEARQTKLNRLVAIRVFPPDVSGHPDFESRLAVEMGTVGKIRHPRLAEIQDFGKTDGNRVYLASEFVEGYNLTAVLQSGDLTLQHVEGWMPQLLSVLETIHGTGSCHGWLNPDIIRVEPNGNLKITGFGFANLAELFGGTAAMNAAFSAYIAPECAEPGSRADHRADLYAVGILLYQMLTGTIPQGILLPPSQIVADLDNRYDAMLARALQADPAARFQSAVEFRDALFAARQNPHVASRPVLIVSAPAGTPQRDSTRPVTATRSSPHRHGRTAPIGKPAKKPKSNAGLIALVVVTIAATGLCTVLLWLDSRKGKKKPPPVTILNPQTENEPEEDDDRISASASDPDARRVAEAGLLLVELRQLAPYDPALQKVLGSSKDLAFLMANAEMLEVLMDRGDRVYDELVSSEEFLTLLRVLRAGAHLPRPIRPNRSGNLLIWPFDGETEPVIASEFLNDYSGSTADIVAVAGDLKTGVALTTGGALPNWGTSTEAPDLERVAAIDAEGDHFGALMEDGRVATWGAGSGNEQDAIGKWEGVAKISLGASHLLAVTIDFRLMAAGSNGARQIEFPDESRRLTIVAIAAESDRSAALAADGTLFQWGGGQKPESKVFPALLDIAYRHGKLFGVTREGELVSGLEEGKFEILKIAGASKRLRKAPQMSPDGSRFAFSTGGSHWQFPAADGGTAGNFNAKVCEERARSSVDVILGADQILAISPRRIGSRKVTAPLIEVPRIPMTAVDDLTVPEILAYREWSPSNGQKRRARLLDLEDQTHIRLRFSDGQEAAVPLDRFSAEDRGFVSRWIGRRSIEDAWLKNEIAGLSLDEYLVGGGYERVGFQMEDNGPMIRGFAESGETGVPLGLIVDTGATKTMLKKSAVENLNLKLGPTERVLTWQGTLLGNPATVKTLKLGDTVLRDVDVIVVDFSSLSASPKFDGLLGIEVLRAGNVAFDFGAMNLLFRNPDRFSESDSDPDDPRYRNWKSKKGTPIRARIADGVDAGKTVSLQKPDGTGIEVQAESLSDPDREYVDLHAIRSRHTESRRRLKIGDFLKHDPVSWEVIDFQVQSAQQIVEIDIEGREHQFFVDSGAQTTKISEEAAQNLGRRIESLPIVGNSKGLDGKALPVRAIDFKTVQLGSRIFDDFRMLVYDFKHMSGSRLSGTAHDGVIGADLLERLSAIIDYGSKRIILPVKP